MNIFATIKPLFRYSKVAYYSVTLNGSEVSLFEEFQNHHQSHNEDKLYHILKWIQLIGQKYGAQTRFFRNEAFGADTSALPPYGKDREPTYTEDGINASNSLRLYCLRANEHVVFLFGGAIKTKQKAQDCPNVKPHFLLANRLTKAIDQAFLDREIRWLDDNELIEVDDDYKLKY